MNYIKKLFFKPKIKIIKPVVNVDEDAINYLLNHCFCDMHPTVFCPLHDVEPVTRIKIDHTNWKKGL